MSKPIAVTLFSGLGSASKALRDLGFNVIPHDVMPDAVETLLANGFPAVQVDVREIDYSTYPEVDVVVGGPPRQPFSQAANNDGRYDERDMIPEFVRAVAELTPRLFVMEEVQTLSWKRHADYLAKVVDDLVAIGYRVQAKVLNAADYGIPQARKRLFVIGLREDEAQISDQDLADMLMVPADWVNAAGRSSAIKWPDKNNHDPVTMAKALGWGFDEAWFRNQRAPEPARVDGRIYREDGTFFFAANPVLDSRLNWCYERPSTTVVGTFMPEVQAAPGYRKAGDGPRQNAKGSVVLTLQERLVLQDMPRDWVVCGSESRRALQVGNSVPCGLIRALVWVNLP